MAQKRAWAQTARPCSVQHGGYQTREEPLQGPLWEKSTSHTWYSSGKVARVVTKRHGTSHQLDHVGKGTMTDGASLRTHGVGHQTVLAMAQLMTNGKVAVGRFGQGSSHQPDCRSAAAEGSAQKRLAYSRPTRRVSVEKSYLQIQHVRNCRHNVLRYLPLLRHCLMVGFILGQCPTSAVLWLRLHGSS